MTTSRPTESEIIAQYVQESAAATAMGFKVGLVNGSIDVTHPLLSDWRHSCDGVKSFVEFVHAMKLAREVHDNLQRAKAAEDAKQNRMDGRDMEPATSKTKRRRLRD